MKERVPAIAGSTERVRLLIRLVAICAIALGALGPATGTATASAHLTITGEYGKEGPAASGLGSGCRLAYRSPYLYLFSDEKIYGLEVSPGAATPIAGNAFPISTGLRSSCGDPDMEVDPVSGNIYAVPSSPEIYRWDGSGEALSPAFLNAGGETCGIAVTASGEVWGGNYGNEVVSKFTASGAPNGTIPIGFRFCKLAVDRSTGDLYVVKYDGSGIVKFTAASGYTTTTEFPSGHYNAGIAINGAEEKLYVGNGTTSVSVYNTNTGALVESIPLGPEGGGLGLAVDEGTDTLFVTVGSGESGVIREYLGVETPKATTGEPTGNSEVSGTADPNGLGDLTECYFEYGVSPAYGQTKACDEPLPISSTEEVHADLPNLIGEETYHYRLVVTNGEPYGIGRGADRTIIPHNVKGLKTEPATAITQESASLNASFEGTNEDTHYYFEYGRTSHYGKSTAPAPGDDAGSTIVPTHVSTQLDGLRPGGTYHFRVVAENSIGVSRGLDQSFTTYELPAIPAVKSSGVTATSADIEAMINPHGFETEYEVEYGPSTDYGSNAPIPPGKLPAGEIAAPVAVHLSGLEGIVYHYRVVARSQWGTTTSGDQTFTFFPPSCPNSVLRQKTGSSYLPDCRAYELVSPENAGNILLEAVPRPAPYAESPTRFLFLGLDGVLSGTKGTNAISADTYVAQRTATGWVSRYTGVPSNETNVNWYGAANRSLDQFLSFRTQCCAKIPYLFDNNENFLGRWPADFENYPDPAETDPNSAVGNFQPSPDFSHMAFASQTNFDPAGHGVTSAPGSAYDYDVATETTTLISTTPSGDIQQDPANHNSNEVIEFPGWEQIGTGMPKQMYPSVSIDGSHILMSTRACQGCAAQHLYMRVNDAITYEIADGAAVDYYGITSDGTKVFFTSPDQLTPDDHDSSVDLYMWSEEGQLEGHPLTRISAGPEGRGNSDECPSSWTSRCDVSMVEGLAETDYPIATDAGDVYFYSPETLDASGEGINGARNLYMYRNGEVQLVSTLSHDGSGALTGIQVSPDGTHAAFVTKAQLTSYENDGFKEMYSFDPSTGSIQCDSCIPNGDPPTDNVAPSVGGLFMSNDGRTFFVTADALVPQDTNEGTDVYEYTEGRPQLISSGRGQIYRSQDGVVVPISLMGVSPNGVDVYFATFETLVPQDRNGAFLKFYDARTGGGFAFTPPSPACEAADECHEAGSTPPAPAVITSDGNVGGGGNAVRSHKGRKKHHKRRRKKKRSHRGGQHG